MGARFLSGPTPTDWEDIFQLEAGAVTAWILAIAFDLSLATMGTAPRTAGDAGIWVRTSGFKAVVLEEAAGLHDEAMKWYYLSDVFYRRGAVERNKIANLKIRRGLLWRLLAQPHKLTYAKLMPRTQ